MQEVSSSPTRYVTATEVRQRFGNISDMTLFRWLRDSKLGFPQPMRVNRRRLFREDEILNWEAKRSQAEAA